MPGAIEKMHPAITRNELAWLATLNDVESRIVFSERSRGRARYRVESGPFDEAYLGALPKHDWSLLVHDVDKHLPAMRKLFRQVPFVPDWRIDDLMVSFAVPGGGVGPHRDNYDVFLCQGIGIRHWRYSTADIPADTAASDDLLLLQEFREGAQHAMRAGDVLYLPPGVAHWGTASRACLTYSIGMRAPSGYRDPDLELSEARPGYISPKALDRAGKDASELGRRATELKAWLRPEAPDDGEIAALLDRPSALRKLRLHGMARVAYDDTRIYVNGARRLIEPGARTCVASLCERRKMNDGLVKGLGTDCVAWLLGAGAFELPENAQGYVK